LTPAARKSIATLTAYREVFSTPGGKLVLEDLIKKHIIADPVVIDDHQATMVNLGMQRLAVQIIKKTYRNEQTLRAAIERTLEQETTHE